MNNKHYISKGKSSGIEEVLLSKINARKTTMTIDNDIAFYFGDKNSKST